MANFDLDDPLGDLLSEGSDDSFFDEPKPPAKRSSISKSPEKKSVTDLFGLEDKPSTPATTTKIDDWLGLEAKTPRKETPAPRKTEKPQKKISFEEDDDILNTLGLEAKPKPDAKRVDHAKKASLMESILGPPKEEDKKFLSLDDLLQGKSGKKPEPLEVSQSTSHLPKAEVPSGYGFSSLEAPREGRRARAKTPVVADPLGLFSNEPKIAEAKPKQQTPKTFEAKPKQQTPEIEAEVLYVAKDSRAKSDSNISEVPDWLGGGNKTEKRKNSLPKPGDEELIVPNIQQTDNTLLTQQKLTSANLEYQNASLALQQQESQVLMALQMRKYEESMTSLQRKQQEVLVKQDQQFNHLLERQFAKQQIIENNMQMQQERINNHIQLLISQPAISARPTTGDEEKVEELKKNSYDEIVKQYEDIIANLKQRHHEEMFLLEESYKKQVSTLEQSMESIENHLKMELDATTHKNREKLESLEVEYSAEIAKYKKKIEDLYASHENEMKQLRENNSRVLEEVKFEYNTIIENIKMTKQTETSVLQEAGVYTQKLETSLKLLDINSRSLLDIREKVEKDYGVLSMAREESIKAKEEEIKLMRLALEKARESADNERSELMAVVRNLEIKLAEQSQNSRDERFALQQAAATLTARTAGLDREAEFNRASIEREREQLKTLRETIFAEQEKAMQKVTEEKLTIHAERIKLETAAKLTQNYDSQRARAEMEAAIQVAKDAAELTDRERENLLKQVQEIESSKRTLVDRERKLLGRERDLEAALEHANRRNAQGEKALEDAKVLQGNYNERLQHIHLQMRSLANRERKLAEEKIAISKERVALSNAARQIKQCGLCAVDNNIPRVDDEVEIVEQDVPMFASVSDADMFRLQLQMSEEQLTSMHAEDRLSIN